MSKAITVTRQVFALDELDDTARTAAIKMLRDENYENIPSDMITESINGKLAMLLTGEDHGDIDANKLYTLTGLFLEWSLGYRQGDGVAFYGKLSHEDASQLTWGDAVSATLTRNSYGYHYSHANCFNLELFDGEEYGEGNTVDDKGVMAAELSLICKKLERYGYAQIEHYTSEPYVIELLNDNDKPRIFNADGTLAPSQFWAAL